MLWQCEIESTQNTRSHKKRQGFKVIGKRQHLKSSIWSTGSLLCLLWKYGLTWLEFCLVNYIPVIFWWRRQTNSLTPWHLLVLNNLAVVAHWLGEIHLLIERLWRVDGLCASKRPCFSVPASISWSVCAYVCVCVCVCVCVMHLVLEGEGNSTLQPLTAEAKINTT